MATKKKEVPAEGLQLTTRWLQKDLHWLAFNAKSNIDNDFGRKTAAAVRGYEGYFRLPITGKHTETLEETLLGVTMKNYQTALGTEPDGFAGPKTFAATEKYQGAHKLLVDGICGPVTRAHIDKRTGDGSAQTDGDKWNRFRDLALAQTGDAYVFGAETTPGKDSDKWDCSEIVEWLFETVWGKNYPDGSLNQYNASQPVHSDDVMKAGTLGFLKDTYRPGISHVAVVIDSSGTMINAKGRAYGVVKTNVGAFQSNPKFAGWRRFPGT
jgi:hypothetical protein